MACGAGALVHQVGVWMLYSDVSLICTIIGGMSFVLGAGAFACAPRHSADWYTRTWSCSISGSCPTFRSSMCSFVTLLVVYAVTSALATIFSVVFCPETGTVPENGSPQFDRWVLPQNAANPTAGRDEYTWRDRWHADPGGIETDDAHCGASVGFASISILCCLAALGTMLAEQMAMRKPSDAASRP